MVKKGLGILWDIYNSGLSWSLQQSAQENRGTEIGNRVATPQQAYHVESTCDWGGKLVDMCSTQNPGVFQWIYSCVLLVLIYTLISSEVLALFFFTCNPRCFFDVDYWCTFSGVGLFHVTWFTWINGVPVHVAIRWISCEECHPFLFHMFSRCIFQMDY